ncbi:hypothetical protein PIB30_082032, partial [Stylosanthes scabra]|nr:hypothetical protein [Stylosanthes scabra]
MDKRETSKSPQDNKKKEETRGVNVDTQERLHQNKQLLTLPNLNHIPHFPQYFYPMYPYIYIVPIYPNQSPIVMHPSLQNPFPQLNGLGPITINLWPHTISNPFLFNNLRDTDEILEPLKSLHHHQLNHCNNKKMPKHASDKKEPEHTIAKNNKGSMSRSRTAGKTYVLGSGIGGNNFSAKNKLVKNKQ